MHRVIFIIPVVGAFFLGALASAPAQESPAKAGSAAAPAPATRIEVDEQAHVIRFYIKGEPKAVLDESGFHVRETISYGDALRDYGQACFDRHLRRDGEVADAE